eukprot:CAMPEP_0174699956 /NCGR_PEP_ID=MMETSP1094-20130205/5068_1 /TAXON_ID=156173 /ORGANISM="Chrysochromulina brevifilum, Strain UTEX LB 985" /LENGTH=140 /DNA_ID=CAMNT_0015897369 /DNA_START=944 /DNA_END=1362 /DNA_ORIENTATION=+
MLGVRSAPLKRGEKPPVAQDYQITSEWAEAASALIASHKDEVVSAAKARPPGSVAGAYVGEGELKLPMVAPVVAGGTVDSEERYVEEVGFVRLKGADRPVAEETLKETPLSTEDWVTRAARGEAAGNRRMRHEPGRRRQL